MAHRQQLDFVCCIAQHLASSWEGRRVLEIGSYNVNGSIRPFFSGAHHIGVDLMEGPGVDLVQQSEELGFPDESFDLCISCECFEHNPNWTSTFSEMHRLARGGGAVVVTCATKGRIEHGTIRTTPGYSPGTTSIGWTYYRNLAAEDFQKNFELSRLFSTFFFMENRDSFDLYFAGIKKGRDNLLNFERDSLLAECEEIARKPSSPKSFISKYVKPIVELPIHIARSLPEERFQNFAVAYLRALRYITPQALRKFLQQKR